MGRELRRKQAKKEGKSLQKEELKEELKIKRYLIILGIIIFSICIIYIISALFITKELKWFSKEDEVTNKTETKTILANEIFKQKEDEYFVYFYDFKDDDIVATTKLINSKLSGNTIYQVDTSSALNINYVSEITNKSAQNLKELRVKSPTLIKISGESITAYYEGNEIITNLG